MRKWMGLTAVAVALVIGGSAAASFDSEWATYRSDKYGFYMLTPPGTRFVEREYGGGWGTLEGSYESIRFLAYGKLGERATPEDIERFGVRPRASRPTGGSRSTRGRTGTAGAGGASSRPPTG
jgi:hypothetical protein